MKQITRCAAAAAIFVAHSAAAQEAFEYAVSGSGVTGSGILAGTLIGQGQYLVNSVSGNINGLTAQLLPQTPCSASECAGLPQVSNGNPLYAASNYIFDDVIYSGAGLQVSQGIPIDPAGLGFSVQGDTLNIGGSLGVVPTNAYYIDDTLFYSTVMILPVTFSVTDLGTLVLPQSTGSGFQYSLPVNAGQSYVLDPTVATGYTFTTGAGDPNFASVLLPMVQTAPFDVTFTSGGTSFSDVVAANSTLLFPAGGVASFSVTGINTADGLNPLDPAAFSTVVTFSSGGVFNGTQTPITATVVAAVPETSTYLMFLVGLSLLGMTYCRKKIRYNVRAAGSSPAPRPS